MAQLSVNRLSEDVTYITVRGVSNAIWPENRSEHYKNLTEPLSKTAIRPEGPLRGGIATGKARYLQFACIIRWCSSII